MVSKTLTTESIGGFPIGLLVGLILVGSVHEIAYKQGLFSISNPASVDGSAEEQSVEDTADTVSLLPTENEDTGVVSLVSEIDSTNVNAVIGTETLSDNSDSLTENDVSATPVEDSVSPSSTEINSSQDNPTAQKAELSEPVELTSTDNNPNTNQPEANSVQWSAVWRPFFSKRTASGFANYIGESTGLTLRVSSSPVGGQFLVEVQHHSEAEWLAADKLIVDTTGYRPIDAVNK